MQVLKKYSFAQLSYPAISLKSSLANWELS